MNASNAATRKQRKMLSKLRKMIGVSSYMVMRMVLKPVGAVA